MKSVAQLDEKQFNLSELVGEYESGCTKLLESIDEADDQQIRIYDTVVSNRYSDILNFCPTTSDERGMMAEVLLEQLLPSDQDTPLKQKTREKLISMISGNLPIEESENRAPLETDTDSKTSGKILHQL